MQRRTKTKMKRKKIWGEKEKGKTKKDNERARWK